MAERGFLVIGNAAAGSMDELALEAVLDVLTGDAVTCPVEKPGDIERALAEHPGRIPVVLDGYISTSAALVAVALAPRLRGFLIAGHRSAEPGHAIALEHLRLRPLLELDMRLGEGTGAALAIPIVRAAARVMREMATFEDAGVADRGDGVTG